MSFTVTLFKSTADLPSTKSSASIIPIGDHTWIKASDGFCCGCPDGTSQVDRGGGCHDGEEGEVWYEFKSNDLSVMKKLAGYLSFGQQAGIQWLVNGVCHQIATRLAIAAGANRKELIEAGNNNVSLYQFTCFLFSPTGRFLSEPDQQLIEKKKEVVLKAPASSTSRKTVSLEPIMPLSFDMFDVSRDEHILNFQNILEDKGIDKAKIHKYLDIFESKDITSEIMSEAFASEKSKRVLTSHGSFVTSNDICSVYDLKFDYLFDALGEEDFKLLFGDKPDQLTSLFRKSLDSVYG